MFHIWAAGKKKINAGRENIPLQTLVDLRSAGSEFQHIAKHRDPAAFSFGLDIAHNRERRPDRHRARVIAFIDHEIVAAGASNAMPLAAAFRRLQIGERPGGRAQIDPELTDDTQNTEHIADQMPPRGAKTEENIAAVGFYRNVAGIGIKGVIGQPDARVRFFTEHDDLRDTAIGGETFQQTAIVIVAVENNGAGGAQALEYLGLRMGDCLNIREMLEMDGFNGGDQHDMRLYHARERR